MTTNTEKIERTGSATFPCPECKTEISTNQARYYTQIPNGLSFCGVRCPGCGKSYTVEILEAYSKCPINETIPVPTLPLITKRH